MTVRRLAWPFILSFLLVEMALPVAAPHSKDFSITNRANAYASVTARGRFAALAWGATTTDGVTDVYLTISDDGGRTFGAPARVNGVSGQANFSPEQPPRIALIPRAGRQPVVVVVWTAKSSTGTRLFSARSENGGKSFGAAVPVPGTDAAGNRGWESIATGPDGSVVALWLDHRDLAPKAGAAPMNHAEHQHGTPGSNQAEGVARAQLSQLFFANMAKIDSARAIARGVCYCCKTAMTTDSAGTVYAAWRQVYDGNVRDIAFTTSADGGRTFATPIRVSDDNWVLDGCPENGPAIAVDSAKRIHVVWPTLVPGATPNSPPTLALFYAMSADGKRFTPRQQIPTEGVPRHPQIALGPSNTIIIAWDEQSPGTKIIALAHATIDESGKARFSPETMHDNAPGTYPFVAATDSGTIVGWTSGSSGQTIVRTTRLTN